MSGVDVAGLVEELRDWYENWSLGSKGPALLTRAADALLAQVAELEEANGKLAVRMDYLVGLATTADKHAIAVAETATRQRDEALAALKAAEERVERLSQALASARCPQEPWRATPERITQKYLRRYPNSKAARSWAGCMVHISTEHGVWRINGQGYTRAGKFDAWVLPFEEAQEHVAHCGPEKEAAFIKVVQPIGSGPSLADAHSKSPSDPGTEQREAGR